MPEELQVNTSWSFVRAEWRLQRLGWTLMLLIVVGALAGLFGPGPISQRRVVSPDGALAVDFLRFVRLGSPSTVTIAAQPVLAVDGELELRIARDWLENMQVSGVTPTPVAVRVAGDDLLYAFAVAEADGAIRVSFEVSPDAVGNTSATVAAPGARVAFAQLVYP